MRSVFLIGFMASGKSEVSRVLAERLKMPCVDLDSVIEEQAGKSIASLFEEDGEQGFRLRERTALGALCDGEPSVISTGGGTPCQPSLMQLMMETGHVVHLATELSTALSRVGSNRASRPLLAKPASEIESLYRSRAPIYRRANITVSTDEKTPEEVASDIVYGLDCLTEGSQGAVVALRERSYPVVTASGSLETLPDVIAERLPKVRRLGLVTDDNVMPLYGTGLIHALEAAGYKVVTACIAPGESSKTLDVFGTVVDTMIAGGLDRSSAIVALGGGVVGDLAGYVASSLYRGVPVVQVPTTLLAMTDSAIGGKTGLNSKHGKNLLGAFWQPAIVWTDPETLTTLPCASDGRPLGSS